jgi:enoyl-CoA hydratase
LLHCIAILGLVSKVFPSEKLLEEAIKLASTIASYSLPVIYLAKEAVLAADNMNLDQGLLFERRLFHSTFALVMIEYDWAFPY